MSAGGPPLSRSLRVVAHNLVAAPRLLLAKRTVVRPHAPVELDVDGFTVADYARIIPGMREVEAALLDVPASADGMRWIHRGAVSHFHAARELGHDYDKFVERVDIARAGAYYRDSVSLEEAVVERDDRGRPTRQLVRIVALPQPNYSSLFGKGNLDIYKLEQIDHDGDRSTIWMWTVHSPNGSAICDDGYLRFSRGERPGTTVVSFLACQEFPYPPIMEWLQMHRWAWMRRILTEDAYRRFFNRMVANIEDEFAGRPFAVGTAREPDPAPVRSEGRDR